jgi:hypothetical protein
VPADGFAGVGVANAEGFAGVCATSLEDDLNGFQERPPEFPPELHPHRPVIVNATSAQRAMETRMAVPF